MDLALGQTPRLRLGNQAAHIPDDFVNLHKSALRQAREDPVRTPLPSPTVSGSGLALRAPAPIPLANWVWTQCSHDCRSAEAFRMSGGQGLAWAPGFSPPGAAGAADMRNASALRSTRFAGTRLRRSANAMGRFLRCTLPFWHATCTDL